MPRGRHPGKYLVECSSHLPVYFLWKYRQDELLRAGKTAEVRIDAPNAHLGFTNSFTVHAKSSKSVSNVRDVLRTIVNSLQQATLSIDARYTCRPVLDHLTSVIESHCGCLLNVHQNEPGVATYRLDVVGDVIAVKNAIRFLSGFGFSLVDERLCSLSKEPSSVSYQ